MRTIRRIAAFVGVATTAGVAHAQSSVTIYGVMDVGPTYVSNEGGAHNIKMDDAIASGDRLGFKGIEDLGGGMKALFTLENGFNALNGQARQSGRLFGRQAWVGIETPWATVTLGRQYDLVYDYTAQYAMSAWASGYATHQGDLDRMGWERLDNAVKIKSADFSGLQMGAMYAFGNVAGDFHEQSSWGAGMQYNHGAYSFGAVYLRMNNPFGSNAIDPYASMGAFTFLGQTTATRDPVTGAVTDLFGANPMNIDSQSVLTVGGSYTMSKVTFGLAYSDVWFKGFGTTNTLRTYDAGASWNVTPAFAISAGYFYSTLERQHYNEASLGFDYSLSKSTDVYLQTSYLRTSSGVDAVQGYLFTPSTTDTQTSVRIGLRHRF
ncbi:porin [Paraburkholderia caballeronis]|uniref:porin n=1 Tax=Paraburkholderia caballeronis TaxID=416943 RepID=UPI0010656EA3|nr:porin [Paraburkholderia caballeronis]TDV15673.1 outer membrane protein OmpU [Paraburkholderia caballeronis]TDV17928.1 outer membrane protein OmpU [Paraburkholderia caballeronis]TDV26458.1 outer membrane protein OmpU [Paraburkholderia caballeronis]TDV33614.1 outer membrane protein OmpU [Paraburkholderia caballeronis]